MTLASMTGFARAEGADGAQRWTWEARSVNARGLDLRFRLPPGLERLEVAARLAVAAQLRRGSVSFSLTVVGADGAVRLSVNREALEQLLRVTGELAREQRMAPPSFDGLLAVRGIIEPIEADADEAEETRAARDAAVLATLEEALAALSDMRIREGSRLRAVMLAQLDQLEGLRRAAEATAAAHPESARERLRMQVAALLEASPPLPEERLAQEAALIAARADVREEIDRLGAHVSAARELLQEGGAVGRRLDFLCQELNREANTICSKSLDLELTRIGLDIKALVEQFREQVQNVE